VSGRDRHMICDHFLTCDMMRMAVGDVCYALILDSHGLILDDAFVRLEDNAIEVLTTGSAHKTVYDYLAMYISYASQSGIDVRVQPVEQTCLALQGPSSQSVLQSVLGGGKIRAETADHIPLPSHALSAMPFLSYINLYLQQGESPAQIACIRGGLSGEDGFELVMPREAAESVANEILAHPEVSPVGVYALDMLRMEGGFHRTGVDVTPRHNPIKASLMWCLSQRKMRDHIMFGWRRNFALMAKGPKHRRISLVVNGFAHGGCRVLANPSRQPIGEVTSVTWSPALGCRVAMALVKPEYARSDTHVLLSVPYDLPPRVAARNAKRFKDLLRQGTLRSSFRRLVPARVVAMPIVPHRYPRHKSEVARQQPTPKLGNQRAMRVRRSAVANPDPTRGTYGRYGVSLPTLPSVLAEIPDRPSSGYEEPQGDNQVWLDRELRKQVKPQGDMTRKGLRHPTVTRLDVLPHKPDSDLQDDD